LNYDKIEQGTLTLEMKVVSIWELVERSLREFNLAAASKRIKLSLCFLVGGEEDAADAITHCKEIPPSIRRLKVFGDSVRITQVLRNLLSNALKFTNEGGSVSVKAMHVKGPDDAQEKSITLGIGDCIIAKPMGSIRISVIDDGAGMTSEQINKLFRGGMVSSFFSVHRSLKPFLLPLMLPTL